MAIVTLQLADVKSHPETRPSACPPCGSTILQKWGKSQKPIRDMDTQQVEVHRYRCTACGRTFRHYPAGVDKADQSLRLQQLATIMWALGLSLRAVVWVLGVFGIRLCHMTVWRDLQAQAERVRRRMRKRRVRVIGLDGMFGKVRGRGQGVVVAVDMGTGEPVVLMKLEEDDVDAVVASLRPLVEEMGIRVLVTDDLSAYRVVAEKLGLEHQVCDFHLMRWAGRALKGFEKELGAEYAGVIEEVRRILREKPPDGAHQLERIWESIHPRWRKRKGPADAVHRFRLMLVRLMENRERYTLFLKQEGVPRTNNRTEQAIGRWRVRSASARGYKSWEGLEAAFWVCNSKVA